MKISKTKAVREILKVTFPDYKGRKVFLDDSGKVTFCDTNWGGGTRNYYTAVRVADGMVEPLREMAPWTNPAEGRTIEIPEGYILVQRSYFQGVEAGVTLHVKVGGHELLAQIDTKLLRSLNAQ
jgi:hypothetical protein